MDDRIQKLYVEASSRCNLRCKMCFRHSWVGERFGDLAPAAFARLMDDPVLRDTRTVFFGGCELLEENETDCIGSAALTCGGCLWGQGFAVCP